MDFIDQLEVLLRTVPQYILFAGIGCYIFAWINKNIKLSNWGDALFVLLGIIALGVLVGGFLPSPIAEGVNEEHIKMVITMHVLLLALALLSVVSLLLKLIWKKKSKVFAVIIFLFSLVVFTQATKLSKVKFELNVPTVEQPANGEE